MTPAQQLRRDIETCEVPHPMFVEHLTALKRRIDDALAGFAPKIVRVPGPSRAGKSSLIASLSRDYPVNRIDGRRHVPVLVVNVPPSATAKLLPKSVLGALGIQVPRSMTAGVMFDLMVVQLRLAGTRVVIFDEISHLVDEGSRVPPRAASDWLKTLSDTLGICAYDVESAAGCVVANPVALILSRILLVFGGHADVLSCPSCQGAGYDWCTRVDE